MKNMIFEDIDSELKKISREYKILLDKALEITEEDLKRFPLHKSETERERYEIHILDMLEMYCSKYAGVNNIRNRLEIFKEIRNWILARNDYEEVLVPKIEEYLNNNIQDLEEDLKAQEGD